MRSIYSDNLGPRVVMSEDGFFAELSTGTDGYAEHNNPEHYLEFQLLSRIRYQGEKPTEQEIFEGLRIAHSEKIQFVELGADEQGRPQAVLGFIKHEDRPGFISARRTVDDEQTQQALVYGMDGDRDIAAALAYGNFAIKVRGEPLVRALTHFYEAIQAGTVYLASGSRLKSQYGRSAGLTMVNMAVLSEEERRQMPLHVVETVRREKRMYLYGW